jgi:hypothetical protein
MRVPEPLLQDDAREASGCVTSHGNALEGERAAVDVDQPSAGTRAIPRERSTVVQ